MSSVVEALHRLGGTATRKGLIAVTSRAAVDGARTAGDVVVLARGRYALPEVDQARSVAQVLAAPLSHRSAALHWGWAVKSMPERPEVIVARNRRLSPEQRRLALVHRGQLHDDDVVDGVTSKERTLLDCLRSLPGDEALAVADSALRDGESHRWLTAIARDARGPGSAAAREIAALASAKAANPFESVLRWISHDIAGLHLRPRCRSSTLASWVVPI